jgi:hypothetical protein
VPANIDLAAAEIELVSEPGREQILKGKLESIAGKYEYILIDFPPSLSLLTLNAPDGDNKSGNSDTGYRYTPRKFSPAYLRDLKGFLAHPFLLRELLNVPKLPFTTSEFYKHLKSLDSRDAHRDYYGMVVDWKVSFGKMDNFSDDELMGYCVDEETDWHITLVMPVCVLDVVRLFKHSEKIVVRGIIHEFIWELL